MRKSAAQAFGWQPALLCVATFLAYVPAIRGGFIWDDNAHVTAPALRSLHGLWRIWFDLGATQQYYPVLHSAFWVEHHLWGDAPAGYHVLNVLLHATSACLLAVVLRRLSVGGAWLAAFIFALHPVCVESVAWISEQKNTLSTVFYLLAALVYLRWDESADGSRGGRRGAGSYFLATGLFLMAILSKSVTASLPAALLVALWWKRGRLSFVRDVRPLAPWLALGAMAGLFTAWVERTYLGAAGSDFQLSFLARCLLAGRIAWFYLGKLAWPSNLIFIYPHWNVDAGAAWQYLFPVAAVALVFALWRLSRRSRGPLAAVLFFGGSLFPALGFINVYPFVFSYVADHFQYLASLGIVALAAAGWARWRAASAGPWPAIAAAVGVAILATLTFLQCRMYGSAETLYRITLAENPGCWMADYNLAVVLRGERRTAEAIACCERSLQLKPDFPQAHDALGAVLADAGRIREAVPEYEAAIASYRRSTRISPELAEAEFNLAIALQALGRPAEAAPHFENALRLRPDFAEADAALGSVLVEEGLLDDGISHYEKALRIRSADPAICNALGVALSRAGRHAEAIAEYEAAVRLKSDDPGVHHNLAQAFAAVGRTADALAEARAFVRLRPEIAEGRSDLGDLLGSSGQAAEAIGQYEEALRLRPDYAEVRNNLAALLADEGRLPEAIGQLREAVRLKPDNIDMRTNLAAALQADGKFDEARAELREVERLKAMQAAR